MKLGELFLAAFDKFLDAEQKQLNSRLAERRYALSKYLLVGEFILNILNIRLPQDENAYMLDSAGGNSCPSGSNAYLDLATCLADYNDVIQKTRAQFGSESVTSEEVNLPSLPKGCSFKSESSGAIYVAFNGHDTGAGNGLYTPICDVSAYMLGSADNNGEYPIDCPAGSVAYPDIVKCHADYTRGGNVVDNEEDFETVGVVEDANRPRGCYLQFVNPTTTNIFFNTHATGIDPNFYFNGDSRVICELLSPSAGGYEGGDRVLAEAPKTNDFFPAKKRILAECTEEEIQGKELKLRIRQTLEKLLKIDASDGLVEVTKIAPVGRDTYKVDYSIRLNDDADVKRIAPAIGGSGKSIFERALTGRLAVELADANRDTTLENAIVRSVASQSMQVQTRTGTETTSNQAIAPVASSSLSISGAQMKHASSGMILVALVVALVLARLGQL